MYLLDSKIRTLGLLSGGQNRHDHWDRIYRRHWEHMAREFRLEMQLSEWLSTLKPRVASAIQSAEREMPVDFPRSVSEPIFSSVLESLARLLG